MHTCVKAQLGIYMYSHCRQIEYNSSCRDLCETLLFAAYEQPFVVASMKATHSAASEYCSFLLSTISDLIKFQTQHGRPDSNHFTNSSLSI